MSRERSKKLIELCAGEGNTNHKPIRNKSQNREPEKKKCSRSDKSKEPDIWTRPYALNLPIFKAFNEYGSHLWNKNELNNITGKFNATLSSLKTSKSSPPRAKSPPPPPPEQSPASPETPKPLISSPPRAKLPPPPPPPPPPTEQSTASSEMPKPLVSSPPRAKSPPPEQSPASPGTPKPLISSPRAKSPPPPEQSPASPETPKPLISSPRVKSPPPPEQSTASSETPKPLISSPPRAKSPPPPPPPEQSPASPETPKPLISSSPRAKSPTPPPPPEQSTASSETPKSLSFRKTHLYCFENALSSDDDGHEDFGSDDSVKDKTYEPPSPKIWRSRRSLLYSPQASISKNGFEISSRQEFAATDCDAQNTAAVVNTTGGDSQLTDSAPDSGVNNTTVPNSAPEPEPSPGCSASSDAEPSRGTKRTHSVDKYLVKPGCGDKCIKKCSTKINEQQREEINRFYWNLSWSERRLFIQSYSATASPKRTTTKEPKNKKRRVYSLKNCDDENVEVCKVFFITTLGFNKTNDKVLYNALQNTSSIDNRGKHAKIPKIDRSSIDQHIDSFHPQISHHRREHAPRRLYLPSDVTIKFMFTDYIEKHPDIKLNYDLYRKNLKSRNISFAKLGNEDCETCESFNLHCKSTNHEVENETQPSDCAICLNWISHRKRYTAARKLYNDHKTQQNDKDTLYFSTDLEKVIMLPRLDTFKKVLFCQRLTAYNQTFAPLGKNSEHNTFAVLWHDAVAGRKQEDIMSCFYQFLLRFRDYKFINLWMDNCSAQNKNWLLFFLMIHLVNSEQMSTVKITFHYLETGHTFMSCDQFHHQVELSMKKMGKVYDFVDFCNAVSQACSKKVFVKEMSSASFLDVKDNVSKRRVQTANPRAYIGNMTKVTFQRGSYDLLYENDYNGQEISLCFLKDSYLKSPNVDSVLSFREKPKGISRGRKDNIISKLGSLMPAHKLLFWKNLPISSGDDVDGDI